MANKTIVTGQTGLDPIFEYQLFHGDKQHLLKEAGDHAVDLTEAIIKDRKEFKQEAIQLSLDMGLTLDEAKSILKARKKQEARNDGYEPPAVMVLLFVLMAPFALIELLTKD